MRSVLSGASCVWFVVCSLVCVLCCCLLVVVVFRVVSVFFGVLLVDWWLFGVACRLMYIVCFGFVWVCQLAIRCCFRSMCIASSSLFIVCCLMLCEWRFACPLCSSLLFMGLRCLCLSLLLFVVCCL